MKRFILIVGLLVAGFIAGMLVERFCNLECAGSYSDNPTADVKREVSRDTLPYRLPSAKGEVTLGTRMVRGSNRAIKPDRSALSALSDSLNLSDSLDMADGADLAHLAGLSDSLEEIEIPIVQREFEGEDYRAWVSGYEPMLDSIFIYARHEVVTIREPPDKPKRWGIGVFAGYGYTPAGFQPCVGISVNYNLWSF